MSSNMIPLSLLSSRVLNNQIHSLAAIRLRRAVLWRTLWQRLTSLLASLSRRSRVSLLRMRLLRLVLPCYNSHCGVRYWTRRIARDDWRCREARASSIPSHYLCFVGGDHMILETVSTPKISQHTVRIHYNLRIPTILPSHTDALHPDRDQKAQHRHPQPVNT